MRILKAMLGDLLIATMLCLLMGAAQAEDATFSEAELDQMMAPIALYPDALLAQILMASTYPADVTEAVKWSKDNPKQKGDAAVEAVQDKSWDPSVMSLAAFPQVLAMMGEKPDWVQDMGDAFLASSETVMDTVQKLRKKAKDEGNLKTTEQQKVIVEEPDSGEPVVIIEPADPEVVYVPSYNPTVVYGTWWWPHYSPWYYHPYGYGYGYGAGLIGFGVAVGVTNALWGGIGWGHGDIDIDIDRHNNINANRNKIDGSKKNSNWKHNSDNRRGVPYKDDKTRKQFENKRGGADKRENFRGRDTQRDKASNTLDKRAVGPAEGRKELQGAGGDRARDSVKKANRDVAQGKLGDFNASKARDAVRDINRNPPGDSMRNRDTGKTRDANRTGNTGGTRDANRARDTGKTRDAGKSRDFSGNQSRSRDNALRGSGNANKSRQNTNRGRSSNHSMRSYGGGGGGRMGGGGGRMGGGGGRGGGGRR